MLIIDYSSSDKNGKRHIINHIRKVYPHCSIRDIISGLYFAITDGRMLTSVGFNLGNNLKRIVKV